MVEEARDFANLKNWVKDFKKQQGRDPFFEDFPADIGMILCQPHFFTLASVLM